MDKTRLQLLAEVMEKSVPELKKYLASNIVAPIEALEAMKIAMKQAFIAGMRNALSNEESEGLLVDFDKYFNKLEE
jgi:hypothetical protein